VSVSKSLYSSLIGLFLFPLTAQAQTGGPAESGAPIVGQAPAAQVPPEAQPVASPAPAPLPLPAAVPVEPAPAPQPAVVLTGIPKEQAQLLAQSGFVDAGPGGFGVRSANKESQLRFHLQVQADAKFWHGTTPAKVNETFFLRRAIPWIDGTLPYGVSFLVAPDFSQINSTNTAAQANAAIILPDAYFQIKILDELQFRFGKFRAPIGLERLQPTGQLFFNEFALATELTPLRDVGAQVQGEIAKGYAGYALGVFNGAVDNAYTDLDPSRYKDFEGRVYAQPLGAPSPDSFQYAIIGFSGTVGRKSGVPQAAGQSTNLPTYKSPGGAAIFSYKTGATPDLTNTAIASGQQRRINAHGYYAIGPFGLLAEYIYSQQRVGFNYDNTRVGNQGWTAEASLFLYGGQASYSQAKIATPFDLQAGTFGAFEVVGRASQLIFDKSAFGAKTDTTKPVDETASVKHATELAGGLNWYFTRSVRFLFSYNHTSYKGGAASGDRLAENVFFGRAQLNY
jgi:phosphate-selective porin OprO and OprP